MSPSGPCYLPNTSWQAQFWKSSTHLPLFINLSWCTFCPPVLFNCIVLAKVANGPHVTKQDGYLSILILLDHPCWSLWFLKSSFYFASVASFVCPPTFLAIPLSLFFQAPSKSSSHVNTFLGGICSLQHLQSLSLWLKNLYLQSRSRSWVSASCVHLTPK